MYGGQCMWILSIKRLKKRWPLNKGLISHFFVQLFRDFDYWSLNRGWPLKGGSTLLKLD